MHRKIAILIYLLSTAICLFAQEKTLKDTLTAYFQEIKVNTNLNKELWNFNLYGPILLVDPVTRQLYANYPDTAGVLKQEGSIYTGKLDTRINIANTAVSWNGEKWAMIMLPLSENKQERLDLLSHELFHRSQQTLGFEMKSPDNIHLDLKEGRVYLRLELEALKQALLSGSASDTKTHLTDALIFRKYRYSLFPGAASKENTLELNEGLAAYTGIMMSGRNEPETENLLLRRITEFQNYPTFVRSFAYITTPLWGYILSRTDKYWNKQVNKDTNLTDYFQKSFELSVPENPKPSVSGIYGQYGGEKLISEETKREQAINERLREYRRIFEELPHLVIRFEKMSISFDPRNIMSLEGSGTVYPNMRVSDNWGILTVTNGALISTNWDKVTLSEPTGIGTDRVEGNGWTLDISKEYIVEKDSSDRNYILRKR